MSDELRVAHFDGTYWEFVYPEIYNQLMDEFDGGCEFLELGEMRKAEDVFKSVLARMPNHIDSIHHLAMITSEKREYLKAQDLWAQGVRIGRKAFPPDFKTGRDRLPWSMLDNRPFLRCLHGYALALDDDAQTEKAVEIYFELLALNPDDNQGVRGLAVEALLALHRFRDVLKVCNKYRGDIMAETLYGRALALFKLGQTEKATLHLADALSTLPLVGREITKASHRLPKEARQGVVTVGGKDEAYYYWRTSGRFWKEDPAAIEWVRQTIRSPKTPAL